MNLKDLPIAQISKFSFVGILNTIVGYGAFLFFLGYVNYIVSSIISHIIGVTHSYFWNKYWTFKTSRIQENFPTENFNCSVIKITKHQVKEFIRFYSVYAVILIVNTIILIFLVEILKFNPKIGQLLVLPIIFIISFTGHKYWSFKR